MVVVETVSAHNELYDTFNIHTSLSYVLITVRKAGHSITVCVDSRFCKIEEKVIHLKLNRSRSEKYPSVFFPLN